MNSVAGRTTEEPFTATGLYGGSPGDNQRISESGGTLLYGPYTANTHKSIDRKTDENVQNNNEKDHDDFVDRSADDDSEKQASGDKIDLKEKERNSHEHSSGMSRDYVVAEGKKDCKEGVLKIKTEPGYSRSPLGYISREHASGSDDDDLDDESVNDYDDHHDNNKYLDSPYHDLNKLKETYEHYNAGYKPKGDISRMESMEKLGRERDTHNGRLERKDEHETPGEVRMIGTTVSPNERWPPGFPMSQSPRFTSTDRNEFERQFLPTDSNDYSDQFSKLDQNRTSYTNTLAAMLRRFDYPGKSISNLHSSKFGMSTSRALSFLSGGEPGDVIDKSSSLLSPRSIQHITSTTSTPLPAGPLNAGSHQYSCHICKFIGMYNFLHEEYLA